MYLGFFLWNVRFEFAYHTLYHLHVCAMYNEQQQQQQQQQQQKQQQQKQHNNNHHHHHHHQMICLSIIVIYKYIEQIAKNYKVCNA